MSSIMQQRRLKFAAPLRNERGDMSSSDPGYIGMDRIESWTGRLLDAQCNHTLELEENSPESTTNRFEKGDILFGKLRPYLAKAWLADRHGCSTTEFLVLNPTEIIHGPYLRYLLLRPNFITEVDASTFGAKMPRASWDFIGGIHIPIPPIQTQQHIAAYLDRETTRIDALVAEKERMLSLLEQKRAALISRAVTRGLNPQAPTKPSALDWLGEIPKHWKLERSKRYLIERDERSETGEEEMLTVSHITGVTPRSEKDVNMFEAESNEGYKLVSPDQLVINTLWAWMGAMGVARHKGIVSPAYHVYRIAEELLPAYVDLLVRIPAFKAEVIRFSKGVWSSRLRLYPEGLHQIWIPVPPLDEQEAIIAHIQAYQSRTSALETALRDSIALLKERRSALITAAVTGKFAISA
jgi:type I restriction enzyme S subunit